MSAKSDKYIDDLASGKLSQQAARIQDGIYSPFIVKKIFMVEDGFNGDSIVCEFYVLNAAPTTVPSELLRPGEAPGAAQPNAVGSVCGMANNLSDKKKREITINVLMGLFAAMFGWSKAYAESEAPADIQARMLKIKEAISGDGTTFTGYPVKCETYRAKVRTGNDIHVRTRFAHFPTTPEEIASCRQIVLSKG